VVRTEFTDAADTLVLDLRAAYAEPELRRLERTFVYSREDAGALAVTDAVAFASPKRFETALITLGRWKQVGPDALLVYDFDQALRVEIGTGGEPFALVAETIREDVRTRSLPTRIAIALKAPVAEATVTTRIAPARLDDGHGGLLRNGGFELDDWCWDIPREGMGSISTDQAASGKASLRIADPRRDAGSNITSARIAAGPGPYELRGKAFPVAGEGLGLYVKFYDAAGRLLNRADERGYIDDVGSTGGATRRWEPFVFGFAAPEGTAALEVWIHSYTAAVVEAYLDDLEVRPRPPAGAVHKK
jgi:hypothetical protein